MNLHFRRADGTTGCGRILPNDWLTDERGDVSCKSCMRGWTTSEKRSWANKKARASEGYSDPDYKGTGALSCYMCGRLIREHPKWPCPFRPMGALLSDR